MNCEQFRRYWSEWHEGWLEADADAMTRHRDGCDACARYDRQMQRLVEELATLPLPAGEASPAERAVATGRRPASAPRRWLGSRWAALAATLVLGIAVGLLVRGSFSGDDTTVLAEPVALAQPGEHRVAVAFDNPRALEQVEFVVELPQGVELAGFPGQRTVRWKGELAQGRSRLQLPLQVAPGTEAGKLVTRIVHRGAERRLVVPLEITNTGGTASLPGAVHEAVT